MELKCAAIIMFSFGGRTSNCKVISVEKASVPSLPARSLHILKDSEASEKTSVSINSSIA